MSDIDKRARELLAVAYEQDGRYGMAESVRERTQMLGLDDVAIRGIVAALTPPDGYVLVPAELTHEMYCAFIEQWFTKVRAIDDTEMEDCYAALLAARPEVSGG